MKVGTQLIGAKEVQKQLREAGDNASKLLAAALYRSATRIMNRSKADFVPVDQGTLRSTGFVQLPVMTAGTVVVEIGYGGPAAPYALSVHENPRAGKTAGQSPQGKKYRHYAKVGQWKYLEQPVNEALPSLDSEIAADISARMKTR